MNKITIGKTELYPVSDGTIRVRKKEFFGDLHESDWNPYKEYSSQFINLNIGSFIIKTESGTILIDTGLGKLDHGTHQLKKETLISEMDKSGFSVTDIDIVFMTHLHWDHVGTNMTLTKGEWAPTFPNAKYFVSNKDWKLFSRLLDTKSFEYIKEQVNPLIDLGLLNRFENEISLTSEIRTISTPGHTPGHTSVLISSNSEKAIITGDAIHIPLQFNHPDWTPSIDRDKILSTQSRQMIINYIEKEHALIAAGHFPFPGFGNIIKVNSKKTYIPIS